MEHRNVPAADADEQDCDLQMASKVVDHLEKQGFLAQAGQKKARAKHYAIDKSEEKYRALLTRYFDPFLMIAHYVSMHIVSVKVG